MAGEIDAVRVVHHTIENRVGIGRAPDEIVPFVARDFAGDDGRSAVILGAIPHLGEKTLLEGSIVRKWVYTLL